MTDIMIGYKHYRGIEKYTEGKLSHLIHLCDVAIENYKGQIVNYPADRMEKYGKPHLALLESTREQIIELKLRLY